MTEIKFWEAKCMNLESLYDQIKICYQRRRFEFYFCNVATLLYGTTTNTRSHHLLGSSQSMLGYSVRLRRFHCKLRDVLPTHSRDLGQELPESHRRRSTGGQRLHKRFKAVQISGRATWLSDAEENNGGIPHSSK